MITVVVELNMMNVEHVTLGPLMIVFKIVQVNGAVT